MTAPQEVQPHDRPCWGCDQTDDHPRFRYVRNLFGATADGEELYHYDCVPARIVKEHPEIQPLVDAARKGTRGDKLRERAVKYATSIPSEGE